MYSKITRPEARRAWPRTRLFNILDAALAHNNAIWISAPAGSGKTTLASSYIEARKIPSLWYQIDPGDIDIGSFFHYLGLAADALGGTPGSHSLPPLAPGSNTEHFARSYMRKLFHQSSASGLIVFDNYQDANSELLDLVLRITIAEMPAKQRTIVLSRAPPPAAFAGLVVNGTLGLLSENDVKLDLDETLGIAHFLDEAASDETIRRWSERAQGWIAGLVLLAKSGDRVEREDEATDIKKLLFDYFSTEIMSHLAIPERDALIYASFLKSMTAKGVAEMAGIGNASELLDHLHTHNCFTSRRHDSYEFHPLFRDFLSNEAHRLLEGDLLNETRLNAAHISIAENRLDHAIDLLIEANAWDELCRTIPAHAAVVAAQGRLATLERWLAAVPNEARARNPWMGFWLGICRLPYDPGEACSCFASTIPLFEQQKDFAGVAASWSKQIESILHVWGDFKRLDAPLALIDRIMTDANLSALPEALHFEVVQNALLALQWRQPHHRRLLEMEERARDLLTSCENPDLRATCSIYLSLYYCWLGRYPKARTTVATLRTVMQYAQLPPPMLAGAKVTECLTAWRVDADFDRCLQEVDAALLLCAQADVHIWDTNLIGQAAAAALSKGDLPVAAAMLERMRDQLPQSRRFDAGQYFMLAAWHAWLERHTSAAKEYITSALDTFSVIGVPWGTGMMHAAYILMMGHTDPAYEEHMLLAAEKVRHNTSTEIEYPLLLARIETALELGEDATAPIAELFAIGRENDVRNCYFWDSALMARICASALEAGIETAHVTHLVRLRHLVPPDPALAPDNWPWPIRVHTLGGLKILLDGTPLAITGKGPAKPLALLQLLVAYGGNDVSERRIIDALWPESDADAALRALDTTLYRLRKLLKEDQAVQLNNKRLSLNPEHVWIDTTAFQSMAEHARDAERESARMLYQRAIDLYRGSFLDDEDSAPVIAERERLQRVFMQTLDELGELYEQSDDWESAIRCYESGLAVDNLAEGLYRRLMIAFRELRRPSDGLAVYQRCRQVLFSGLAILPSMETESILETLKQLL